MSQRALPHLVQIHHLSSQHPIQLEVKLLGMRIVHIILVISLFDEYKFSLIEGSTLPLNYCTIS
jgi:hypothetical protein